MIVGNEKAFVQIIQKFIHFINCILASQIEELKSQLDAAQKSNEIFAVKYEELNSKHVDLNKALTLKGTLILIESLTYIYLSHLK